MKLKIVCFSFLLFWIVSCSSNSSIEKDQIEEPLDSSTSSEAIEETSEAIEELDTSSETSNQVPSLSVTIEPTPYSPIAASLAIESSFPASIQIVATSDKHQVVTAQTSTFASSHIFPLVGLRQSQSYDIEVLATDESGATSTFNGGSFVSGEINYPLPNFDLYVDLEHSQPGITLIEYNPWSVPDEFQNMSPVVGIDNEGQVVFWYQNTSPIGAVEPTNSGTFISLYFPLGAREFDLLGNVIHNWEVSPNPLEETVELRDADALSMLDHAARGNPGDPDPIFIKPDWVNLTSFHHEVFPMQDGNFLGLSTTNHQTTPEQRELLCPGDESDFEITSDVIVEFTPNGEVIRTWDLWDVLDIEEIPGKHVCNVAGRFESIDFRDWTHANAVIYDKARDAILVSSRHTDQIIAFDHLDELGPQTSVRWILGDQGTLPLEGELFYHPHAVELQPDGSILIYDNGNFRPDTSPANPEIPNYSRAVLYEINDTSDDLTEWGAVQLWEHRVDDVDKNPIYATIVGDADRLENGNVLITHGGIWPTFPKPGTQRVRIIEVIPEGSSGGDIVWDLALGDVDTPVTVYRAERLPSLYFGPLWEEVS